MSGLPSTDGSGSSIVRTDKYGPHPESVEEFVAFVASLTAKGHDYNTSAEALRDVTLAAFNLAGKLFGNSGFQAGWAAMQVLSSAQGIDGPWGIVKAETMLYPQYPDPVEKVAGWQEEWGTWLAEQAAAKLAENPEEWVERTDPETGEVIRYRAVHPNVRAHWERLAGGGS